MKVFIGVGHGGNDPGAVTNNLKEKDMNLTMARAMKSELERYGINVKMSRESDENDPLSDEIKEANSFDPDIAIDIHNNSGKGTGFEAYVQTGKYFRISERVALSIESEVKSIGQKSRGIKTRKNSNGTDYFGFLREIDSPAIILEGVFLDSEDHLKADTIKEQEEFGKAYARGIVNAYGIEPKKKMMYRVQVGAFSDKANAQKLSKELESKGYASFVTEKEY